MSKLIKWKVWQDMKKYLFTYLYYLYIVCMFEICNKKLNCPWWGVYLLNLIVQVYIIVLMNVIIWHHHNWFICVDVFYLYHAASWWLRFFFAVKQIGSWHISKAKMSFELWNSLVQKRSICFNQKRLNACCVKVFL